MIKYNKTDFYGMLYEEVTHKIIGCAMNVHATLGSGFQEVIYQRAMAIEMRHNHLEFSREHEMKILYKGVEIGTRRVDFFVGKIMVELKATTKLDDSNIAQILNYLEAYVLPVGLLINFGNKSLEFKRVYKSSHPMNNI
ncbi:MAG: GxxExxY protein [Flavitalea sp.]